MTEDNFIREFIIKSISKIVKRGNKFCVVSKDGKRNFGCFNSRQKALKRLREVEFFSKNKDRN
jgi:hypothetical protein